MTDKAVLEATCITLCGKNGLLGKQMDEIATFVAEHHPNDSIINTGTYKAIKHSQTQYALSLTHIYIYLKK